MKRCETINFELRKSHKNVIKTMKKFLEKNEKKVERAKKDQTESCSYKVTNEKTTKVQTPQVEKGSTKARRIMDYFLDEKCDYL